MAKSIQKRLQDASDLAAVLGLKSHDVVAITVYGSNLMTFQLSMRALGRVVKQLRVPASKIELRWGESRNLHVSFTARGVDFSGMVMADAAAEWIASIEQCRERLTGQPYLESAEKRPLGLPAPVAS